jgi:hypothetical protein
MNSNLSIEKITKGLQAAERIKQLFNSKLREDAESSVKPDSLSVLRDTLQTVMEFWPDIRGGSFNRALQQSNKYSSAYREIKSHLKTVRGKKPDMNHIMNTFKVILPVLDNRQKVPFDKIIKILQILNS